MPSYRRCTPSRLALAALLVCLTAAAQPSALPLNTDEEIEDFLQRAEIIKTRGISQGITNTRRVTLSLGGIQHDAQVQDIDVFKTTFTGQTGTELNFRDSYKFNIAAYRLSRLLGISNVPVSVERRVDGKLAAVTWWIDDVLMTERTRYLKKIDPPDQRRWNQQIHRVRIFDQLIHNVDRNLGNLVITEDWTVWMIDHTRAFRWDRKLKAPQQLRKCDRALLQAMERLSKADLEQQMGQLLRRPELQAILERRDLILDHFERQVETHGEADVLFDYSVAAPSSGESRR